MISKNRDRGALFCQSINDFPCPVMLGKNMPSFGLHRFKQGLKFVPTDDEGFVLRGDKQHLLYKGRRKSHRFTILGDTAFEYDCILKNEPESNVISLRMEGAENYDFFRQPDFVKEPFLKGSYAVYKKITMVGEGTGKLCHIHRPEIIDARGRRCWGDVSVVGNELHITIPEWWLSEAKYPVVVDPTIGTTTIGSLGDTIDMVNFTLQGRPVLNTQIGLSKYYVAEKGNSPCTAYVYCFHKDYSTYYTRPCIYTDNNNRPYEKKSLNETDFPYYGVDSGNPPKWVSRNFDIDGFIEVGSYIWFGVRGKAFTSKYDIVQDPLYYTGDPVVNALPFDISNRVFYTYYARLSWYFTYTAAPLSENYVRTITQGINLIDSKRLTGNYIRKMTQNAGVNSLLKRFETFYRKCVMTVNNTMNINRFPMFVRNVTESIKVTMDYLIDCFFIRIFTDNINIFTDEKRKLIINRNIQESLNITENNTVTILFLRSVPDGVNVTHTFSHWGAFIRGLRINAESTAETGHIGNFYRVNKDVAKAVGIGLRSLFMFVRIVSKIVLRDYVLRRFLVAKEDFKLKSPICREIILDSKIV